MRIFLPIILILCLVSALAIGVHSAPPPADFTFTVSRTIHTLDPVTMSYVQDMHIADALWEGLMRTDPKTTQVMPGAVVNPPELSADHRRYLFTLRDDARWSNGDPLAAHDFVRSWRRAIEPGTADLYSDIISNYIDGMREYVGWRTRAVGLLGLIRQLQNHEVIKGADVRRTLLADDKGILRSHLRTPIPSPPPDEVHAYWQQAVRELGQSGIEFEKLGDELLDDHLKEMDQQFVKVGVRALDDRRLEVRLQLPTAYFPDLTAFATYLPVHVSVEKLRGSYKGRPLSEGGLWTYDPQWTKPDYHRNGYPGLISNGPYRLAQWRFKQRLRLERNPHYWDAAHVPCKTIDALDIDYQNAAFMLFEQHHIDFLMDITMDYTPELVKLVNQGVRNDIHTVPSFGTYYLTLNCAPYLLDGRPNPLADARVRRALTRAVDRKAIVDHVQRLNNPVSTTFVPRGQIPGYHSAKGLDFDPDLARKELATAGHPNGEGLPVIDLLYNTESGHEGKMQAIKRMWEQELGLRVQLVAKETKAFAEDKDRGRFMVGRGGWFGDYNDPTTFLDLFRSDNGNNVGKFVDAKYDDLLAQAARELDPARRLTILSQAEQYAMEEQLPIVPIFTYVTVYAWRPEVTGLWPNPRLQFPLHLISVEKKK